MSRRASLWLSCTVVLCVALGTGGYLLIWGLDPGGLPLTPAPVASSKERLVVGKLVQVSAANEAIPHQECIATADPAKPGRLLVAAIYSSENWAPTKVRGAVVPTRGIAGYRSEDGGNTWQVAFEYKGDSENSFLDPALAFGPNDLAHFVCLRLGHTTIANPRGDRSLEFSRSSDGGKIWGPLTELPPDFDRPWVAADTTTGPYQGRLYCLVNLANSWDLLTFPDGDPANPPNSTARL